LFECQGHEIETVSMLSLSHNWTQCCCIRKERKRKITQTKKWHQHRCVFLQNCFDNELLQTLHSISNWWDVWRWNKQLKSLQMQSFKKHCELQFLDRHTTLNACSHIVEWEHVGSIFFSFCLWQRHTWHRSKHLNMIQLVDKKNLATNQLIAQLWSTSDRLVMVIWSSGSVISNRLEWIQIHGLSSTLETMSFARPKWNNWSICQHGFSCHKKCLCSFENPRPLSQAVVGSDSHHSHHWFWVMPVAKPKSTMVLLWPLCY